MNYADLIRERAAAERMKRDFLRDHPGEWVDWTRATRDGWKLVLAVVSATDATIVQAGEAILAAEEAARVA